MGSGADAVQLNEVRHLVALRGGRLHLLTGVTGEGGTAPFDPGSRYRLAPDITEHDVYVYGPPARHDQGRPAGLRNLRVLRDRRTTRAAEATGESAVDVLKRVQVYARLFSLDLSEEPFDD